MVKRVNVDLKQLKKLYEEVKTLSNNFRDISSTLLAENSQRLLIFRLASSFSMDAFAKICNRSEASIYNLEKKPRNVDFKTAEYYTAIIKTLKLGNIDNFDYIKKNYQHFYGRALNGINVLSREEIRIFAKKGSLIALKLRKGNKESYYKASRTGIKLQGLTSQEREITKILQDNNILYKTHEYVGKENVDVFIDDNLPIVISCCRILKNQNITKHARRLMYQAYRIKYRHPKVKYVAILSNLNKNLNIDKLPFGAVDLLNEICDGWFVDSNLNDLITFIKVDSKLQAHQT